MNALERIVALGSKDKKPVRQIEIRWPSMYGSFACVSADFGGLHFSLILNGKYRAVHWLNGSLKRLPSWENVWRKQQKQLGDYS